MGNNVFANGREVACKAGDGKVVAAFPDVCLTPPSPPAGPIPIPYPNFSFAKDTAQGSKTVKISRKEVMLRDKSHYKKCTGDEAATKAQGQGVITHTITGKVYFISWSMDVEFEGKNAVRHLDMTTSNHASLPGNEAVPMADLDSMSPAQVNDQCLLRAYGDGEKCCPDGQTGHHVMPDAMFRPKGQRGVDSAYMPGMTEKDGLVICVDRGGCGPTASPSGRKSAFDSDRLDHFGLSRPAKEINKALIGSDIAYKFCLSQHGQLHNLTDNWTKTFKKHFPGQKIPFKVASATIASHVHEITGCDKDDIQQQLDNYHEQRGIDPGTAMLNASS